MCELPRIIAVDLDGTVFTNDHKTILPDTYKVLERCVNRGMLLVPTTGRGEGNIPLGAFPQVQYVISGNGGLITNAKTGEILRAKYIPHEDIIKSWEIIRGRASELDLIIQIVENRQLIFERKLHDNLDRYAHLLTNVHLQYIRDGKAKFVPSFDEYLEHEGNKIIKISFPGRILPKCPELREELDETGLFEVTSDGFSLELNAKGCHKGEALMWLCDYLGLPQCGTVAFGDGYNDISMLRMAGWGVAMGNASQEVKAAAKYCTAPNTQDGIAAFIEKYFLTNEEEHQKA